jgi:hypothetical protein
MSQNPPASHTRVNDAARICEVIRTANVTPDREMIARQVGLRADRPAHRRWYDLLEELLDQTPRVTRPRGIFRIDDVQTLEPGRLVLHSGTEFRGGVSGFLHHSTAIATFVVTIGSGLERLSRRWLAAGQIMKGTIADAIASEMAEAMAGVLHNRVRIWGQANGLEVTPRYSPGYCGLHVKQQVPLFASLPARDIGVRLTPSCLMLPIKSVSGLIGLGPPDQVNPHAYPCELCDHAECAQRRATYNAQKARQLLDEAEIVRQSKVH